MFTTNELVKGSNTATLSPLERAIKSAQNRPVREGVENIVDQIGSFEALANRLGVTKDDLRVEIVSNPKGRDFFVMSSPGMPETPLFLSQKFESMSEAEAAVASKKYQICILKGTNKNNDETFNFVLCTVGEGREPNRLLNL